MCNSNVKDRKKKESFASHSINTKEVQSQSIQSDERKLQRFTTTVCCSVFVAVFCGVLQSLCCDTHTATCCKRPTQEICTRKGDLITIVYQPC